MTHDLLRNVLATLGVGLERVEITDLYTGFAELLVPQDMVDQLYKPGGEVEIPAQARLFHNQLVLLVPAG